MASLLITFTFCGFLAPLAPLCVAENVMNDDISMQSTSLLQVGTFHIEGDSEKETSFSSKPLEKDTWGFDEDDANNEDADNDSEDLLDVDSPDAADAGQVMSEGISELQISSERGGQHAVEYPPPLATPAVVQSPGPVSVDHEIPGSLRQAVVQSIQQPMSHPTAGLVATSAETEQTSHAAFGQLSALEAEFKELREDDSSHVKQLMYTVHLREKLRDQLRTAQEQLEKDNEQLAEQTAQIIMTGNEGAAADNQKAESAGQQGENADSTNNTVAAMLLQAAISSRQHRELTGQQIATEALNHVQALMQDIAALRKRDEDEMTALRHNVDGRESLRTKIENRKAQLQSDAGALLDDLSKIRGLVEHESEVPGEQVAQSESDAQDGPKVAGDAQAPSSGQQPLVTSQEQMNMLQQQVVQQQLQQGHH
jgi:hypothetical protein